MQDLGEQLRRARQEKNLTLEDVHSQTKIQIRYLEALERGDSSPFAGEVYFKGALRNFAQVVGLDPEQLLSQLDPQKREPLPEPQLPEKPEQQVRPDLTPKEEEQPKQVRQDPAAQEEQAVPAEGTRKARSSANLRRKSLSINWPIVLLAIILLGATIWFAALRNRGPYPPVVTPPAEELPSDEPGGPSGEEPGGEEIPGGAPALEIIVDPDRSDSGETAYLVSKTEKLEINLNFTGSCWVQLFSDDREIYQQTYRQGQKLYAEGREKIWIRLGNPQGVELTVNGKAIGGLRGQINAHNYLFSLQP